MHTYVAETGGALAGGGGIGNDGHVAFVYVRGLHLGDRIRTCFLRLAMGANLRPAGGRYFAEASALSLPLFERFGFRRIGIERVDRDGVPFERLLVERPAS